MRYIVVSSNEWLYPDITEYPSASAAIDLHAPRDGYASVQILLPGTTPGDAIEARFVGGAEPGRLECYRLIDVMVERNASDGAPGTRGWVVEPGVDASAYTTRQAPFRVYDALMPFAQGGNIVEQSVTALYLAWKIGRDAVPGVYKGSLELCVGAERVAIDASVEIHKARLPEKSRLFITNWYNAHNVGEPYGFKEGSEEWYAMFQKLMAVMRRTRQTHILISLAYVDVRETGDGGYSFDFARIERVIRMALAAGFEGLEMGHICVRNYVEVEKYWLFYTPNGKKIYADSPEGYRFLALFLPQWKAFLEKNGWYNNLLQHVGDEPHHKTASDFRIICGMVRKFLPGAKLFDALGDPEMYGSVDAWVPLNREYQKNRERYEEYRRLGDDIWHYTCCGPGGKFLNRFLDFELIRPRLLHWGNYLYRLKGYLHWGFNYWQLDGYQKDLYEHSCGVSNSGSFWPAGDTHICYPGNAEGPWPSMRAERMRNGAEDCELLYLISDRDEAEADALCRSVMRSFDDYDADPISFEAQYRLLLAAADRVS